MTEHTTTRAADGWPRKAWTHHDLDRMAQTGLIGPDERVELIEGEIVPLPAKGQRHERVRLALNAWIYQRLTRDRIVLPEPGWRPSVHDYVEPDFLIVPSSTVPPEFPGTDVLLAIEISDSSFAYDTSIKRDRYARLGVREYWVIHAWDLMTRVHRGPAVGVYAEYREHQQTALLTPGHVPEVALRLSDLGIT
jgi:Uma2 family endonuclease